jgi:hypothetical protein
MTNLLRTHAFAVLAAVPIYLAFGGPPQTPITAEFIEPELQTVYVTLSSSTNSNYCEKQFEALSKRILTTAKLESINQ